MEKSQGGEVRSLDVTQSTVLKSKVPLLRPGASEQLPSQASLWVQFSCMAIVLGVYFSNKQLQRFIILPLLKLKRFVLLFNSLLSLFVCLRARACVWVYVCMCVSMCVFIRSPRAGVTCIWELALCYSSVNCSWPEQSLQP